MHDMNGCVIGLKHLVHGQGESLAPQFTRGSVSASLTGARAKVWCLLIYEGASLCHRGQGISLVPTHTRGSVSALSP